jgi:hypothetical protein
MFARTLSAPLHQLAEERPRTQYRRSSQNSSTRHSDEYAFVGDALGFLSWHHALM